VIRPRESHGGRADVDDRAADTTERAELLRKELANIVEPEPEGVVAGPGAGGMRLVPERVEGMGLEALTSEYQRIMEIAAGADGPVMAKDVAMSLGRELTPGKAKPVCGRRSVRRPR